MASQSLYRKWRSQTFSDLVGQEPVVRTLKNALASGNISHAYLFTGPRGTGKTSTARLLAKTLNCLNRKDGEPCNVCEQCREITAGNSFNVIEIDAASNRGIDSIRELREKVLVRPSSGKYKVYILDEAHMLTTEAFNALLKTLEEPPEHAIFVMATTDVHKMLPTVLSRCQRFDFKRITTRQIVEHLHFVAVQEQVTLGRGAAELIARAAAGGMRDALSLLDQAIAYSGQEITLEKVQAMLGVADPRAIQKFITYIAQLNSTSGLHLIHELAEAGADMRQINAQVAEYWRAMMLAKAGANIAVILDSTADEVQEITQTAQLFCLEELTECARIFAQNELMQKNQGTPQLGLELALLTSIDHHRRAQSGQIGQATTTMPASSTIPAVHPVQTSRPVSPVQERPATTHVPLLEPPAQPAQPAQPVQSAPLQLPTLKCVEPEILPAIKQVATPPPSVPEEEADMLPDWDEMTTYDDEGEQTETAVAPSEVSEVSGQREQGGDPLVAEPAAIQEIVDSPLLTVEQVREKWENIKRRVKSRRENPKESTTVYSLLVDFAVVAVEGSRDQPTVVIQAAHEWHYKTITDKDKDRHKLVEWAVKIELGQECHVRFVAPGQATLLPPPLALHTMGSRAANTGIPTAPQRSAYRERSASAPPTSSKTPTQEPMQKKEQEQTNSAVPLTPGVPSVQEHIVPPLARTSVVRENTMGRVDTDTLTNTLTASESNGTRREYIEQKAKSDPVVQEVVRRFKADIKEIRPK